MSHEDGALVSERLIRINGTVTGQNPMVDVNGVVATISGGEFDAIVNIGEGENTVIATATDPRALMPCQDAGLTSFLIIIRYKVRPVLSAVEGMRGGRRACPFGRNVSNQRRYQ